MSLNIRSLSVLVILCISSSVSADKDSYRAAVLELVQFADLSYSPSEVAQRNLKIYDTAAIRAAIDQADIIVFPECGLFPLLKMNRSIILELSEDIPNPKLKTYNPCKEKDLDDHPILTELSCIARETGIFVVANMIDRKNFELAQFCEADTPELCTQNSNECPDDGNFYYNTNVVFNRKGVLVAKYYKKHLYFEPHMKTSDYPETENSLFETDFGNFTTAICFDLVYKDLVDVANKPEVSNVAFSTYWFNHLPFLYFASPIQQAFAIANKVNVLASNIHDPRSGTLGSGIFSGHRGALIYTLTPDGQSKLLVSNVPKVVDGANTEIDLNAKRFIIEERSAGKDDSDEKGIPLTDYCSTQVLGEPTDKLTDYRCSPPLQNTFEFVKLEEKEGNLEVCTDNFCCSLSYEAVSMNEEYFLGYTANILTFNNRITWKNFL
ncbi:hypothetical protein JTE90_012582 [Oedothorax gibbosus]|uniref:CN hydrolase domain-containing protein n=1 Tax=Oedothorax gibbosus TaxID=931172 RepID=A0AAV6TGA9_9ARAC|nr:hypothetical protein JTE90_012582 [Oedothorax gibbosus]